MGPKKSEDRGSCECIYWPFEKSKQSVFASGRCYAGSWVMEFWWMSLAGCCCIDVWPPEITNTSSYPNDGKGRLPTMWPSVVHSSGLEVKNSQQTHMFMCIQMRWLLIVNWWFHRDHPAHCRPNLYFLSLCAYFPGWMCKIRVFFVTHYQNKWKKTKMNGRYICFSHENSMYFIVFPASGALSAIFDALAKLFRYVILNIP